MASRVGANARKPRKSADARYVRASETGRRRRKQVLAEKLRRLRKKAKASKKRPPKSLTEVARKVRTPKQRAA